MRAGGRAPRLRAGCGTTRRVALEGPRLGVARDQPCTRRAWRSRLPGSDEAFLIQRRERLSTPLCAQSAPKQMG